MTCAASRSAQIPYPEITRIRVEGLQNYEFVIAEQDRQNKWILEKPVRGRMDSGKIYDFVQALTRVSTENFVAGSASNLRIYGLASPQLKITVTTEKKPPATQPADSQPASQPASTQPAEIKTTTLLVGGKTGNQYFAMLEGEPSVFQISESTFKSLNVPILDLRERAIAGVDGDKIETLEVQANGQMVRLVKNGSHGWVMTGAYTGKAEFSAVDDLVKAVTHAFAVAFEDDPKQLTSYGFEKPRARVLVTATGQVVPVEILVGANTPSGEMTFVKNAGEGTVAVLKKADADALIVDPGSLLDRAVTTFAADDVQKMEITRDGRKSVLVRRQDNTWQLAEPVEAAADRDAVQSIMADLSNLRARKVVSRGDGAEYGLAEPSVVATIHVHEKAVAITAGSDPACRYAACCQPASRKGLHPAGSPQYQGWQRPRQTAGRQVDLPARSGGPRAPGQRVARAQRPEVRAGAGRRHQGARREGRDPGVQQAGREVGLYARSVPADRRRQGQGIPGLAAGGKGGEVHRLQHGQHR